jgi:hypothetical protein
MLKLERGRELKNNKEGEEFLLDWWRIQQKRRGERFRHICTAAWQYLLKTVKLSIYFFNNVELIYYINSFLRKHLGLNRPKLFFCGTKLTKITLKHEV